MTGRVISVMLVDDHSVVRAGYRRLIETQTDMRVGAEAADGEDAYRVYKAARPDIVVLDLSMPGRGGVEVIRRLRQWDPAARVLVFTMHLNVSFALQAFQAGAAGYITKSSPPELLITAVRDVCAGRKAIGPDIGHALALTRIGEDGDPLEGLTAREFEIFRLFAEARTTAEIAQLLNLSAKTVANYHSLIKAKLGAASDFELARLALRTGVVEAGSDASVRADGREDA